MESWKKKRRQEYMEMKEYRYYMKNMKDVFEILMTKGNPKLAIRYAKRIVKDGEGKTPTEIAPGTKVYELVEELAKYLPEKFKMQFID